MTTTSSSIPTTGTSAVSTLSDWAGPYVTNMLGNAAEWVNDWQGPFTSVAVTDPEGPGGGENRVFRGGCYKMPANEARANFRNGYGPKNQVEFLGFRPVRSL